MKLENLKTFNHGAMGIAYAVTGLTSNQYNDIYLQACEMYNRVEQYTSMSLSKGEMTGYILCK